MAVKLEVIMRTPMKTARFVSGVWGLIDKKDLPDEEVGVRQRLWEVMNQTLNKEFNGVDFIFCWAWNPARINNTLICKYATVR